MLISLSSGLRACYLETKYTSLVPSKSNAMRPESTSGSAVNVEPDAVAVSVNVSVVTVLDVTKLVILTRFETVAICVIVTTCVFVPLASSAEVGLVVIGVGQLGEVHHGL